MKPFYQYEIQFYIMDKSKNMVKTESFRIQQDAVFNAMMAFLFDRSSLSPACLNLGSVIQYPDQRFRVNVGFFDQIEELHTACVSGLSFLANLDGTTMGPFNDFLFDKEDISPMREWLSRVSSYSLLLKPTLSFFPCHPGAKELNRATRTLSRGIEKSLKAGHKRAKKSTVKLTPPTYVFPCLSIHMTSQDQSVGDFYTIINPYFHNGQVYLGLFHNSGDMKLTQDLQLALAKAGRSSISTGIKDRILGLFGG